VILAHDIGDGHVYVTLYAHLDSIDVEEGATVTKGQQLGALGGSCQGQVQCGSFGTPHLHFALHRDSSIGGSGTGGSYGGVAVVPELIDGAEDLTRGDVHISANTEGEPPPPPPPDPSCVFGASTAELVAEEDGACARKLGPSQYWHLEDGSGGASTWTYAIDAAAADNRVRTSLHFESAAHVELFAVIPAYATSAQARYRFTQGDTETSVVVDQAAHAGAQVSLGSLSLAAGALQIELGDNTGEPYVDQATSKKVAFDALIVRRISDDPEEPPPEEPPPEEPPPEEPPREEPPPEDGPGDDDDAPGPSVESGCASSPTTLGAVCALLALLSARRRR
jgi:Peptidase family M23